MKNKSALRSVLSCLFLVLAFAVYSSPARANTAIWNGEGDGGDWFDHDNWDIDALPTPSTDAFINDGGKAGVSSFVATARSLSLGATAGDSGTVSIDGTNGWLSVGDPCSPIPCTDDPIGDGSIYVGRGGSGALSITDGGTLTSDGYAYIALEGGGDPFVDPSNGTVTVDGAGSTWTLGGEPRLFIGGANDNQEGLAHLSVTNGGAVIVNHPSDAGGGVVGASLGVSGTITGDGTLTLLGRDLSLVLNAKGTIAPTGTLTINGNLNLTSSATTLCNVTPTANDRVDVLGTGKGVATLGGHLIVILSGSFTQTDCPIRFTLLHAENGRTGTFSAGVSILGLPPAPLFTPYITYDANNVYLDILFNDCN